MMAAVLPGRSRWLVATFWAGLVLWGLSAESARAGELTKAEVVAILAGASEEAPADLSGRDLSALDLGGVDFKRAKLAGANLAGANLASARLSGADLSGARVIANLTNADLRGADLSHADLGADMRNQPMGLLRVFLTGAN